MYRLNLLINQLLEIMSYIIAKSTLALTIIIIITFATSCDAQITDRNVVLDNCIVLELSINPR